MPEWRISTTGEVPIPAHRLAAVTYPPVSRTAQHPRTFLLTGDCQRKVAACGHAALLAGHRVVLLPAPPGGPLPDGTLLQFGENDLHATPASGSGTRDGWDIAMVTSGSTTGTPRAYGFSTTQLDVVTAWYEAVYQVTNDSIIVTALPAAYNFTFVAGVLLTARLGARLHLSRSPQWVLDEAAQLARQADRLVVLANPVVLDQAVSSAQLPANVMIDSGGAPLSTTAITDYRDHGIDLREGYGLTETASLTHFDTEATTSSLGTVGAAMSSVRVTVTTDTTKPVIDIFSPATGIPLDPSAPLPGELLRTTDLGHIDEHGRLRLLGRTDDEQIGGLWPRDTLDILGPLLGRRCALVRHPSTDHAAVRLLTPVSPDTATALRDRAADALGLPFGHVTITHQGDQPLLHSVKLSRRATNDARVAG